MAQYYRGLNGSYNWQIVVGQKVFSLCIRITEKRECRNRMRKNASPKSFEENSLLRIDFKKAHGTCFPLQNTFNVKMYKNHLVNLSNAFSIKYMYHSIVLILQNIHSNCVNMICKYRTILYKSHIVVLYKKIILRVNEVPTAVELFMDKNPHSGWMWS